MKNVKSTLGIGFAAFGLLFAGIGGWFFWSDQQLAAKGVQTTGTVIDLSRSRDSDGDVTYRPVVEFVDQSGTRHEFVSKVGSSSPGVSRGESVEVIYDPWEPNDAMLDTFSQRFLFPLVFGGFGLIFAGVGFGFLIAKFRREKLIARLQTRGMSIQADYLETLHDTSTKINGRSPYRVVCQANHPATGKLQRFESDAIWVNPGREIEGSKVRVLVDPANPKHHYVDLSRWIGEELAG